MIADSSPRSCRGFTVRRSFRWKLEAKALPSLFLPIGRGTSVRHYDLLLMQEVKLTKLWVVIVMITPVLINRIGWKTYIIFTITNVSRCRRILTLLHRRLLMLE